MRRSIIILLLLVFCEIASSYSQDLSEFSKEIYVEKTDTLPYRILLPNNYDKAIEYPLLIFLHGSGERGNDNELQLIHGAKLFIQEKVREEFPAIVVFPQCRAEMSWNNAQFSRMNGINTFEFPATVEPNLHMDLLEGLIDHLKTNLKVNTKRIYVGGLSMGGMGTFEIVHRNPHTFAAAFAICGGANPGISEKIKHTPWWIFHGEADNVVPVIYSQKMFDSLNKLDAEVKLTVYPSVGHDSWTNAFAETELLPWLFSHTK